MFVRLLFSPEIWRGWTCLFNDYLKVIIKEKLRLINFSLLFSFLFLFPLDNFYSQLNLTVGRPVVAKQKSEFLDLSAYPVNLTDRQPDWLSAQAALVIDLDSRALLFAKNPDLELMPASTTKMMTALIVLDNYDLDQVIRIEEPFLLGQVMGLQEGEQIRMRDLLYGLLVQSGNDAAEVLAGNFPGGRQAFIDQMNQKATRLYLKNTHFTNPTGIEEYGHYSTVHDLALLAAAALENKTFREIVATKEITVVDISGEIAHPLTNVNELLGEVRGLKGVKTGWTALSGECLVTFVERDNQKLITVVLGSQDRFGESRNLIEWAFANHQWQSFQPLPLSIEQKPPVHKP